MYPKSTRIPRTCEQCGNAFEAIPSNVRRGNAKYCSRSCYDAVRAKQFESRMCEGCGITYSANAVSDRRYCTRECRAVAGRTREERTCPICGASFWAVQAKIARGNGRYCSRGCFGVSQRKDAIDIFWQYTRKGEKPGDCWIWTGALNSYGYGVMKGPNGRQVGAHRFSLEIHKGAIAKGMLALHSCPPGDNPACVNPEHLRPGTAKDNAQDAVLRGRAARGERSGTAKLTRQLALEIRQRVDGGMSRIAAGALYGVGKSTVGNIMTGQHWAVAS